MHCSYLILYKDWPGFDQPIFALSDMLHYTENELSSASQMINVCYGTLKNYGFLNNALKKRSNNYITTHIYTKSSG